MTNGDNSNILVARVARETFGVERVVARIYDPRRAAIYQRLGIPTVATVAWTTERVLRRILPDAPAVEWVDPSAKVCLVERRSPGAVGRAPAERARGVAGGAGRRRQPPRRGAGADARRSSVQEGDIVYLARAAEAEAFDTASQRRRRPTAKGGH